MQLEDKVIDGRDAALAESQHREDVEEQGEEAMPEVASEAVQDADLERRSQLLGAIRMVLAGQTLSVGTLQLPAREALALEALQVAAEGKSADLHQFVYAEDRRDLLEQALAVLQPNLTRADEITARELHAQFADLAERVGELREQLSQLEDAQDELEGNQLQLAKEATDDKGDKPVPTPSDPDAPRPASTLAGPGPEAPTVSTPPSTLTGPGPEVTRPAPPTTLIGPDLPAAPPPPSTLAGPGPEAELRAAPSTLSDGPEVVQTSQPSALGDGGPPVSEDPKSKKSWWRKPFG